MECFIYLIPICMIIGISLIIITCCLCLCAWAALASYWAIDKILTYIMEED